MTERLLFEHQADRKRWQVYLAKPHYGRVNVHFRERYEKDGALAYGKGVCLPVEKLPELVAALNAYLANQSNKTA